MVVVVVANAKHKPTQVRIKHTFIDEHSVTYIRTAQHNTSAEDIG